MSVIPVTNAVETQIVSELRTLIGHLGDDGGLMSSSLYETAQVLRMAPDAGGTAATAEWLLSQQADDGGWGEVGYPHARDAVTLAVALALHSRSTDRRTGAAVKAAVSFLAGRAEYWKELPVDLPTAMELRLPRLLAEASEAGLDVPAAQYAVLEPSGERKRRILLDCHLEPGSPGLASWESWGDEADPNLLDEVGQQLWEAWLRQRDLARDRLLGAVRAQQGSPTVTTLEVLATRALLLADGIADGNLGPRTLIP